MTRLYSMPIRTLLFLIVFVVALPAAGIIAHSGFKLRREALDQARKDTQRIVETIEIEQQRLVSGTEQLMTALAQLPVVRKHDAAGTVPILRELLKLNPMYANMIVADRDGTVWATAVPVAAPFNIAERRYFRNALASGQLSSGEYIVGRATSKPVLNLGLPLKDDHGDIIGVIGVGFVLDHYRDFLSRMQLPAGANAVILDHKGIILSRAVNPGPFIGKEYFPAVFKAIQEGPETDTSIRAGLEGDLRIISHNKVHLKGEQAPYMYVTSGIPVEVVLKRAHKSIVNNVLLFTSVLAMALVLAWRIGKRAIVDRVTLLEQASQRLARGDLDERIAGRVAGGELGHLGETFDAMAHELALRTDALRESERNYREMFNATHDAIFVHDAESGAILEVNNLAQKMSGFTREEMLHGTVQDLSAGKHPYSLEEARQWIRKAVTEGPQTFEWHSKRKNGELFWTEIVLSAWNTGGKERVLAVARDITERKNAEDEIRKLNASLQQQTKDVLAANRELEAFSYTLSHDLRTPLTRMYTAGQILTEMYGEALDENGRMALRAICESSEQMEGLIEAILGLSGVIRSELHAEEVDLSNLAAAIVTELHATAPERRVDFVIAPGVTAVCDPRLIRVVLENLLGNALKYSRNTPAARIEFGTTEHEGETVYYVRDNGTGFDMKDVDKLFTPFERLHAARDFPGTGIGLATVRRVVNRHGGKVWAEGEPGKGATFYFTL